MSIKIYHRLYIFTKASTLSRHFATSPRRLSLMPHRRSRSTFPANVFNQRFTSSEASTKPSTSSSSFSSIKSKVFELIKRDSRPAIAVLRLSGNISDSSGPGSGRISFPLLNKKIEKCFATPRLKAVCLQINSPGGSAVQSELIAKRIQRLASEKEVKVYAFIEDAGASGGYFLACAAHEIYASESSIVGSIGVLSYTLGLKEAAARLGIEGRARTAGERKLLSDPLKDETEANRARTDRVLKNIHTHFIEFVKASRGDRIDAEDEILFSGEFWTGKEAVSIGLIDGLDDVYSFVDAKFGRDVKMVEIKSPKGLKALLNPETVLAGVVGAVVDRIETNILADDVSKLKIKL